MPTSHKPRKRFVPKHHFQIAMATLGRMASQQHDAAMSRSTAPLNPSQVRDNVLYCRLAVDAIRVGQGNGEHVNHLALATNISLLLCEMDIGGDWIDKVREAQDALVTLTARHRRIGRYVLSGPELQRMNTLLDLHDAQLTGDTCTEGVMVRALAEIRRRVEDGNVVEAAAA